jgi:hypothetical protein
MRYEDSKFYRQGRDDALAEMREAMARDLDRLRGEIAAKQATLQAEIAALQARLDLALQALDQCRRAPNG